MVDVIVNDNFGLLELDNLMSIVSSQYFPQIFGSEY